MGMIIESLSESMDSKCAVDLRRKGNKSNDEKIALSLLLAACPAIASQAAPFAFGIVDGGNIYAVDIAAKQSSLLYTETNTTAFAQPNALAFDAAQNNLYYRSATGGDLFRYSIGSGVRSGSLITGALLGGGTSNAAFYAGSYWAIRDATDTLVRVSNLAGAPVVTTFDLDGGAANSVTPSFGDIAISPSGLLYGHTSNNIFFRADISALAGASSGSGTNYISDATGNQASLQVVFNPNSTIMYGHNFAATGANDRWYTIDFTSTGTAFGNATAITGWNDSFAYRDIAGSAATIVPEAGTGLLVSIGGLLCAVAGVTVRRRSLRP